MNASKEIIDRLTKLQLSINLIQEHIEDITLNEDDICSIKEARQDLRTGKTRRL